MADYCPTFAQRRCVLGVLKAEIASLKAMEAKLTSQSAATTGAATGATPDVPSGTLLEEGRQESEQYMELGSRCMQLASCRLGEKATWLSGQMKRMIERGELTADEQRMVEAEFEEKLCRLACDRQGGKQTSPGAARAAEELRAKLETVRQAKPHVWRVKFEDEIAEHERRLAALLELERPKVPLPLAEVQKLSAKPRLLKELAEMKAASRGWFADGKAE